MSLVLALLGALPAALRARTDLALENLALRRQSPNSAALMPSIREHGLVRVHRAGRRSAGERRGSAVEFVEVPGFFGYVRLATGSSASQARSLHDQGLFCGFQLRARTIHR